MIYDKIWNNKINEINYFGRYYVATVGYVTEDVIKKYIQKQSEDSRKKARESPFM